MYTKCSMNILKGSGDFFALDIGTNAVRVVHLKGGEKRAWSLQHVAYVPIDNKLSVSDSAEARKKLGEQIMTAVGQGGIKIKDVVIGLPSSKTFTTVVDVPEGTKAELEATMKYQVEQYIPTAADDSKVDWALLGPSLRSPNQQEVLISSVAKSYSEDRLEFIESLGFNVVAAEPDAIAMVRALTPVGHKGALFEMDMSENSTDIAVLYDDVPRLIRTIPTGVGSLARAVAQNLNVQEDQARQFILKFGLAPDRLEGQVLRALENTLDMFASELTKSIKFFETRYPNVPMNNISLSGLGSSIPQLDQYLSGKLGKNVTLGNPWQDVSMSSAQREQLSLVMPEFATAIGLAKRRTLL